MASPIQPLVNIQLTNSATALYTALAGFSVQISKVVCVNTATTGHTVTLAIVPANASYGTQYITTDVQGLLPLQSWNSPNEAGLVLAGGDSLYGLADAGSVVNIFASGVVTAS